MVPQQWVNKQDLSAKKKKKSPKSGCKGALGIKYIAIHRVAQFIFGRSVRNWAQNDTEKQSGLLRAAKYWCAVVEDTQDCPENLHICLNLCVV